MSSAVINSIFSPNYDVKKKSVKATFKCPLYFKSAFKNSVCSLTISVGQEYHQGEKLRATINLINKTFKYCHIMICDTLQRHTMAITSSKHIDLLSQECLIKGDQWIEENKNIFSTFEIPYSFIRWNKWLNDPKFKSYQKKILSCYEKDNKFKIEMYKTIEEFYQRFAKRETCELYNYDDVYRHCFDYLIEECAVQLLWSEHSYNFEIYPNERNPILSYCYEKFIEPRNPELLRPLALKFKKINQVNTSCN